MVFDLILAVLQRTIVTISLSVRAEGRPGPRLLFCRHSSTVTYKVRMSWIVIRGFCIFVFVSLHYKTWQNPFIYARKLISQFTYLRVVHTPKALSWEQ